MELKDIRPLPSINEELDTKSSNDEGTEKLDVKSSNLNKQVKDTDNKFGSVKC